MLEFYGKTDIGIKREENQDSLYFPDASSQLKLFIVADGMGGYAGGKLASEIAKDAAVSYITKNLSSNGLPKETVFNILRTSINFANTAILEKKKDLSSEYKNMGTTIAIALIYNNTLFIAHVGDSRIYRLRKNIIRQLTKDHSYVENLVQDGTITREESFTHPQKNMLTKALGIDNFIEPTIKTKGIQKGDILLLCSDGLTNMVRDDKIFKIISENIHDIKSVCNILITEANNAGGLDNSTAIVVKN